MRNLLRLSAFAVVAALSCIEPALAQDWPTRPMTMVVTFAAGSGDDVLARILTPRLSELLGQQVVVENVGGAGGMIGANRVARAAPDGYQFVLGGTGTFAANQTLYKRPLYDATTDFEPVVLISEQPILLITRNELPAANLQEFMDFAKKNQSKMQFGSGGTGSATHLACLLLDQALGINVTHVAYRSATLAMQDLIAGRIDYICPILSTALGLVQGDQVKAIAILSKNRTAALPNVASAMEQGLAGLDAYIWNGVFLPKGTPTPIVNNLHDAMIATMNTPDVRARLKEIGGVVVGPERRSPQYLEKFVKDEIAKWATPIKASGISMD